MELIVLVDNTTLIDRYYRAEPGLSFILRDGDTRILFDCGYSDLFIANADAMKFDLLSINSIVLSHGHIDHTGGLLPLIRFYHEIPDGHTPEARPSIITHPATFGRKVSEREGDVGCPVTRDQLAAIGDLHLSDRPLRISDRIWFLGEIPRTDPSRTQKSTASVESPAGWVPDPVIEDSALVYCGDEGLVIICGCTHAGIEHTVSYAREICGDDRVTAIIGGLHLYSASPERIAGVADWCAEEGIPEICPCHCTGLPATIAFSKHLRVIPIGVGSHLSWDEGPVSP